MSDQCRQNVGKSPFPIFINKLIDNKLQPFMSACRHFTPKYIYKKQKRTLIRLGCELLETDWILLRHSPFLRQKQNILIINPDPELCLLSLHLSYFQLVQFLTQAFVFSFQITFLSSSSSFSCWKSIRFSSAEISPAKYFDNRSYILPFVII